jgi:hypothetical protein
VDLKNWGASFEEVHSTFACDTLDFAHDDVFHRAVDVAAPAPLVYRWLCQLRVAPYSYDLIDNFGRRSPPHLIPGLAALQVGQRVMIVFRIAGFNDGHDLTLRLGSRFGAKIMGDFAGTYRVRAVSAKAARIVARVYVKYPGGAYGRVLRRLMPFFDFVMFRKQLLTLRRYAERDASAGAPIPD